jgi:hypothetical protein
VNNQHSSLLAQLGIRLVPLILIKSVKVCFYCEKRSRYKTKQELMKKVRVCTPQETSGADEHLLGKERKMRRVTVRW